jgi:hypothetical protein
MAIDANTGIVYPLPIDAYSGLMGNSPSAKTDGKLTFNLNSDQICIQGAILAYRAFQEGNFCFQFKDDRFIGHHTEYMYPNNDDR